ncbi:helix-turn-helix domain-containing protein [Novosphingobium sp. KACC 22771]|uniref:AraC-like ligand-binding domain-containing protein n=1 Tax=Novosphingobium sp. KACC 22771 TaxID=3025670 RepID=UPI0023662AD4|nr:helix-turn-helix domain-containing protein [Novosphingobium sp. KACC 22771]WDF74404.1 helix-turn-helix domain-containing protein [Novosphingobium sp. KACC 22771]
MQCTEVGRINVTRDHRQWRDAVCEALIDLDVCIDKDTPFQGAMRLRNLHDTLVMDVQATAHSVTRDKSRIGRSHDDYVLLSRISSGSAMLSQNGRDAILGSGDFAIYDTAATYHIGLRQPFEMTVMRIERDRFSHLVGNVGDLTAIPVRGDSGTGRVASLLIGEVCRELDAIGDATMRQMRDTMLGMVAAALSEIREGPVRTTSQPRYLLIQRAMRLVEDELGNESLSCEFVAQRLGISGRYLRKLFADQGRPLSDFIWERRLVAAHNQLATQRSVQRSITSIAFDCGFKDSAHFSRAFRARFGISPRDFRGNR